MSFRFHHKIYIKGHLLGWKKNHHFDTLLAKLKPAPNVDPWPESTCIAVAWSLATDGWISPRRFELGVDGKNRELMEALWSLVRPVGSFGYLPSRQTWRWRVRAAREILWVLLQVMPYLPAKKKRAERLMRKCLEKIKKSVVL